MSNEPEKSLNVATEETTRRMTDCWHRRNDQKNDWVLTQKKRPEQWLSVDTEEMLKSQLLVLKCLNNQSLTAMNRYAIPAARTDCKMFEIKPRKL